jgi:hypothetical protein
MEKLGPTAEGAAEARADEVPVVDGASLQTGAIEVRAHEDDVMELHAPQVLPGTDNPEMLAPSRSADLIVLGANSRDTNTVLRITA